MECTKGIEPLLPVRYQRWVRPGKFKEHGLMDTIEFRGQTVILDPSKFLRVYYTNWKGESAWRRVFPLPCPPEFNTSSFHPNRWIIRVWDLDKWAERSYDLLSCHQWTNTHTEAESLSLDKKSL